jgi:N-acetylglucosaminyldiphosphoundecaprenol N-acetyl-beta-D-mannosaminyltransferase
MSSVQSASKATVASPESRTEEAASWVHGCPGSDFDSSGACPAGHVLGMRVDATSYRETASAIAALATTGVGGAVCVATVHMVMEAFDDPEFQRIVNAADRVTPDGVPLVWALRLLGFKRAQRVYGPSLLPVVCELAAERQLTVGFYGGSPEVLDTLIERISQQFPGLRIPFAFAPPFRALTTDEDEQVVDGIANSETQILFVGLGCPKQERWIAEHRDSLSCVMIGVGAAFDFQAGHKAQAPLWMQNFGLEWLFRLCTEPRRLWWRYLYHNPRFLYHFARELVKRGKPRGSHPIRERNTGSVRSRNSEGSVS